ncbi:hypothetical protein [Longimicrobium terrae]|uniref:Uncharacterized protein n=1 Tax=Longimicrobium terrae TaxID=1639882 RepID=A0A841H0W0_9BACT|nr:hypothetical protein [Longimicrobium terrae]MBB4637313.1 hypothetical protein [Longimicrobium terrae]MBB6071711.1 hypothetical protein [Longimicrobium terrae]NNC28472.1 hypothetical protein [Longimicrobium terrae]
MNTRALSLLLVSLLATAACGDGGGSRTTPLEPVETAEFHMTLGRSANSAIPAAADSALIRIWNSRAGVNAFKAVAIPAPGTQTQVQFSLPANTGYSVGVVAFTRSSASLREGLAAGVTHEVSILADQANTATVNVQPVSLTMSAPAFIRGGTKATLNFTLNNPELASREMLGGNFYVNTGMTPWTSDATVNQQLDGQTTSTGYTFDVTAPTVEADTAIYLQGRILISFNWEPSGTPVIFYAPSVNRGQALFRVPVRPASGTITVLFDRKKN